MIVSSPEVALINYAAKQLAWDTHATTSEAEQVRALKKPLEPQQLQGYAFLLQSNNNLLLDGVFGSQSKQALINKGYLSPDWWPYEDPEGGQIGLTNADYAEAAQRLSIPQYRMRAVAEIESNGKAFTSSGRVPILFEGHLFWFYGRQIGLDVEQINREQPSICYPSWTKKHYLGGDGEYGRRAIAARYHKEIAYGACSYGMFQIVAAFHHKTLGFASSVAMAEAFKANDARWQLITWAKLAERVGWAEKLRHWDVNGGVEAFVLSYNGSGQVAEYSRRLRASAERWRMILT